MSDGENGNPALLAAAKAVMQFLGVNVGAPRLPIVTLDTATVVQLHAELESVGFFDWIKD